MPKPDKSARYIEAPENYVKSPGDPPALFLAGGITGCEDWQSDARDLLNASEAPVVILNPRRADFDVTDPAAGPQQIAWEYRHLRLADVIMFWFPACDPAVTTQPIALFELGGALERTGTRLAVGVDPGYPRLVDVIEQCRLARPTLPVYVSLAATVSAASSEP